MRVLIVPMAAMTETRGPFSRVQDLVQAFLEAGIETALCAAHDVNYREIKEIREYPLSLPMPLGLPRFWAVRAFPAAEKLGITSRKQVHSFEEVLLLTGALSETYIRTSTEEIRNAIRQYKPDYVYSEFHLSAILAAKLEGIPMACTYSYPVQPDIASSPQFARGLKRYLKELGLPAISSALDVFQWVDLKLVPSCYELEPFQDSSVLFCGTFRKRVNLFDTEKCSTGKKIILAYLGNGSIPRKQLVREAQLALKSSPFEVYLAGMGLPMKEEGNFHIAPYFAFDQLFPDTAVFLNHGGQNSIADGLLYGIPQILCPGRVFERKYNALSIEKNHAGLCLNPNQIQACQIRKAVYQLTEDRSYQQNAAQLGQKLWELGGTRRVIDALNGSIK